VGGVDGMGKRVSKCLHDRESEKVRVLAKKREALCGLSNGILGSRGEE